MKKIVCIDLDGTLAHYVEWQGEEHFGSVINGASEALLKLKQQNWLITIYTTRTNKELITNFLEVNDLVFDYINEHPFQPENAIGGKPYADAYIDDRGIQFNGDWELTINELQSFKPWEKRMNTSNDKNQFSKEFLNHDFDQSYQQLRHYDSLNWDITKFSFIELLLGITAVWAIYGFALDEKNANTLISSNYDWIIPTVFGVCYTFSILSSFLISRNRVYYSKVARYLNEYRKFAMDCKPYGFQNSTKFYTNTEFPPAFDPLSTQLVCLYVIQLVSAFMFGAMLYCISKFFFDNSILQNLSGVVAGVLSLVINLLIHVNYMKKEDKKLGEETS